jgi:hypothetical protein
MVCKEDTEVYTGSGGMSLRLVRAARVLALICSRGYKRTSEGTGSQVSGGEVLCGCVSVVQKTVLPYGSSPLPFYMTRDRDRMHERERSPGSRFSSSLRVVPAGPVDDDGGVPAPLPGTTCVSTGRAARAPRCAW